MEFYKVLVNLAIAVFLCLILGCSPNRNSPAVKSLLLQQLKNTHTEQDWFVPLKKAIAGVTSEQSKWKDEANNHSIGELVSHLIFWNERVLTAFKEENLPEFNNDNDTTFEVSEGIGWIAEKKLDSIQNEWEQLVEKATDDQLMKWHMSIANICTHNTYHTGQIIYIRKQNGWWE